MYLDPRAPRFAAWLTTAVLVAVLLTSSGWLALAQAAVFAVTAINPKGGPYALLYRALVAPRLGPPSELEPAEPVRFAQWVGFGFAAVSAAGYLAGVPTLGIVAAAFALVAAFLNAAFGLCLGCEAYLLIRRFTNRPLATRTPVEKEGANA
ncbi:MAG: DUF4395 domain-containing protein [Micromonosporaceae bacterium]